VERHSGRLHDAQDLLDQARSFLKRRARDKRAFPLEFATTLKELGGAGESNAYFDSALNHYAQALIEFEHLGNGRYTAIVENNHGYLLLTSSASTKPTRTLSAPVNSSTVLVTAPGGFALL